jgi:DNA polymerase (family X)
MPAHDDDTGYRPSFEDEVITDGSGRRRWRRNAEVAAHFRQLQDFLLISGYAQPHATRYGRLALVIESLDESVALLDKEGRLKRVRGIGPGIAAEIGRFLRTGSTEKYEWAKTQAPETVLDLLEIPGFGVKTVSALAAIAGVIDLQSLRQALDKGKLGSISGIGPKTIEAVRAHLSARGI